MAAMHAASAARWSALYLVVTLFAQPGLAIASPTYPGAIASALDVPCEPQCTLCHTRASGGFGTVNMPFGRTARMTEGLECCSPATLGETLEALRVAGTDSDGDGTPDIEEIAALTDPNDEADVDLACMSSDDGDGGCSVTLAGRPSRSGASLFVVLAAVVAARIACSRLA
jgi:hypothetical protein